MLHSSWPTMTSSPIRPVRPHHQHSHRPPWHLKFHNRTSPWLHLHIQVFQLWHLPGALKPLLFLHQRQPFRHLQAIHLPLNATQVHLETAVSYPVSHSTATTAPTNIPSQSTPTTPLLPSSLPPATPKHTAVKAAPKLRSDKRPEKPRRPAHPPAAPPVPVQSPTPHSATQQELASLGTTTKELPVRLIQEQQQQPQPQQQQHIISYHYNHYIINMVSYSY
jgi:hypothetical protein